MIKCKDCRHLSKLKTHIEALKDRRYHCNKYHQSITLRYREDLCKITCIKIIKY